MVTLDPLVGPVKLVWSAVQVKLEIPALREIQVQLGRLDQSDLPAILDKLAQREIRENLVQRVRQVNQEQKVSQVRKDPEGIQDQVVTKDQLGRLVNKEQQDSQASLVCISQSEFVYICHPV